ncbi:FtsX-like permease family protein [Streptomyces kronopolitis]|uniref:FtsX-like permease family protein n=1 Tax=Streptomyces kronopolitis TaxID=1612435 RepID=UPI003431A455
MDGPPQRPHGPVALPRAEPRPDRPRRPGDPVRTLPLIGSGLIISTVGQLHERRRLLSVLAAYGTRRATPGRSMLWQTAVPVVLGLGPAPACGLALGSLLLTTLDHTVTVDWPVVAAMTGTGGAVILLVTALSLPALWRLMRPDGLRTE